MTKTSYQRGEQTAAAAGGPARKLFPADHHMEAEHIEPATADLDPDIDIPPIDINASPTH